MGHVEDTEPPAKRLKAGEVGNPSDTSSSLECIAPPDSPMARFLQYQGKADVIGSKGIIRRVDFVRIITQALHSLGYEKTTAVLEEESGITLHSFAVNRFMRQIIDGDWNGSMATLQQIGILDITILNSVSFLILEQKVFELLEKDKVIDACETLRTEIVPLCTETKRVHELACSIMSSQLAGLAGSNMSNSRLKLLEDVQKLLPPAILIPEERLQNLIEQALTIQKDACYFHNIVDSDISLYTDHNCGKDQLPYCTTQVLHEHDDEVWFLKFSNQGKYLASASVDRSAIVWEVSEDGDLAFKHKLIGHQEAVIMVAWSPDDSQILTCGLEGVVRCWNTQSGECIHVFEKMGLGLISCGWLADGKQLYSGATDRTICLWDVGGKELDSWKGQQLIKSSNIAPTKNGRKIICSNRDNEIFLLDMEAKVERLLKKEARTIIDFSLSGDDKYLLVNLANQEINLWSIDDPDTVIRYKGHKQRRLTIRSCFGGFKQALIASGSEDSLVYIWLRRTGELIHALPGHSGAVNCVNWNPSNPQMLASASDDHTIRIWGLKQANPKSKHTRSNGVVHHCNENKEIPRLGACDGSTNNGR